MRVLRPSSSSRLVVVAAGWASRYASLVVMFVATGTLLISIPTHGQQRVDPDEVRIRSLLYVPKQKALHVESNAVQVGVVVRDRQGNAVSGLKSSDFELTDRGSKETISSFQEIHPQSAASSASAPDTASSTSESHTSVKATRFIALFFDDLDTEPGDFRRTQVAAEKFIRESLSPSDRLAVFANSGEQSAYFTDDRAGLIAKIEKTHGHPSVPERGLHECSKIDAYKAYLIINDLDPDSLAMAVQDQAECGGGEAHALQEMVKEEADETWGFEEQVSRDTLARLQGVIAALARMPGQRTLVIASAGFLTPTLQRFQDALVAQALHAGVTIDSLDAKGLGVEPIAPALNDSLYARQAASGARAMYEARMMAERQMAFEAVLEDLADSTGGSLFHNNNDLNLGFRRLAAAPESAYLLSFSPDSSSWDGKYHQLKVKLTNHEHYEVDARPGYFAPTKEGSAPTAAEKVDAEMLGSDTKSDFPVTMRGALGAMKSGMREITVQTHVDISKLPFEKEKDRHVEKLTFVAGLFDAQNKFVTGKEAEMDLAFKQDSFERFSKSGITGTMSLEAPPGAYRLRVVVEEAVKGEMTATSRNIQIQ